LVNGQDQTVDSRNFTLTVDRTTNLRDREAINVSWTGAHPTVGAYAPDPNSADGRTDQYPVVLLQCRGTTSTSAPADQQIRPETCWTQTLVERITESAALFPPWRVDRYAAPAQRQSVVNAPSTLPASCQPSVYRQHWLPFVAASGTTYYYGPNGCGGVAPESSTTDSTLNAPGNTTYAPTDPDGTGNAKFSVWTNQSNASLGCTETVPCALVVIPIEGISCDVSAAGLPAADQPTGAAAVQADHDCKAAGSVSSVADEAVQGGLWWSASNWRNRVMVPLSFAPGPADCSVVSDKRPVDIYGSELLTQATQSWASKSCLSPQLSAFRHVQTGEPQARNLLGISGGIKAAFTSDAPSSPYPVPVVNAPVAFTGFVVGYSIDGENRKEYSKLKLTPRLLAKLLTESYPGIQAVQNGDSALSRNPLDISRDPEFIALNPAVADGVPANVAASTILNLSSDSDVVYALTSYINADPEARAWLDGKPDPWGMIINPNYVKIALPVDQWPLLDDWPLDEDQPPSLYQSDACLKEDPTPYLNLIASPLSRMATISLDLQYSIAQSQVVCTSPSPGVLKLTALGRQLAGVRFMLGITSLADAARYQINVAQLQTHVDAASPWKFTDASGRTFVAPTDDSLRAAAKLLTFDSGSGTWPIPYPNLVGPLAKSGAYPGAMVVYAAVPTGGLSSDDAASYANVLKFLATDGQVPGPVQGQLPTGYLPLTAANNLGPLAAYTLQAAEKVRAQPDTPASNRSDSSNSPDTGSSGFSSSNGSTAPSSRSSDQGQSTPTKQSLTKTAQSGRTSAPGAGVWGMSLPVLLVLMLLAVAAYAAMGSLAKRRVRR